MPTLEPPRLRVNHSLTETARASDSSYPLRVRSQPELEPHKMPNAMHLHLMLNHAPLFGELFASALFLTAAAARSRTLLRTALGVVLITALASIPVFFSGHAAADAIGKVEG